MNSKRILSIALALSLSVVTWSQSLPKREFRGAWLHTVGNKEFPELSADSIKNLFIKTLDLFEKAGINAVIFQVRPQADAFYISEIEPWSRFLSGEQGVAPKEIWDPLQFMIDESHKRGMELHAWCNPYRVTSNDQEQLHPDHLYFKNPKIFKKYGKQLYFDPGEPESIEHTVKVIADIVTRYDIDAIHFDDYFYPYPIKFEEFHDDSSFIKYSAGQGFEYWQKGDWRRNNVATLIKTINDTIKAIKPWVRFGISPFGIHRNLKDTPDSSGSNTTGLSNYEELFADIPHWIQMGWIDYNVPQLYWEIGHKAADYKTLIEWWSSSDFGRHLYIGQRISTFKEQLNTKVLLSRTLPNIEGNVWWPGWFLSANTDGLADSLTINHQRDRALIPTYTFLDSTPPAPVSHLKIDNGVLTWDHKDLKHGHELQRPQFFAVYRFPYGVEPNIENSAYLYKVVNTTSLSLEHQSNKKELFTYIVTAIDRCRNESPPSKSVKSTY